MSLDPVNIDFLIGGNVDEQAPKTKKALDSVADAGKEAVEQTRQRIKETKSNIAQVEADLKKLQKSYDTAAPGKQRNYFADELSAAKKALEEEKNILSDLEKKVESTAASHARLRTQIMELKDGLAKLEMQGKRGTEEYRLMADELGRLSDQMGDTNMQVRILADDEKGFKGVASGVSGLAGAMSAAVGTAALFGAENEELTRIQTRLQAVMAITIGLQQVAETLNKDSYFSVVLLGKAKQWWTGLVAKAATTQTGETAATSANTAAKKANATATGAAAAAEAANTVVTGAQTTAAATGAKANLGLAGSFKLVGAAIASIPGIGWLIGGISLLGAALISFTKKSREAKKAQKEFSDTLSEGAKQPISVIEELSSKYSRLGDDMQKKEKFIEQNKKVFEDLGVAINGVADAENLLIRNKDKFIQAQIAKAKSAVFTQQATEEVKNLIEAQQKLDSVSKIYVSKKGTYTDGYGVKRKGTILVKNSEWERAEKNLKDSEEKITGFLENARRAEEEGLSILTNAGISAVKGYSDGTVGALEDAIAKKREKLKELSNPSEYKKQLDEINTLQKQVDKITGGNKKNKKEEYNAAKDIQKQLLDINRQTSDLLFQQREDNLQKTLSAIDRERDAELDKIKEKEQDIVEKYNASNKDKKGFKAVTTIAEIDPKLAKESQNAIQELTDAFNAKRKKTEEDYQNDMKRLAREAADSRVKIENDYEEQIKKAREAGLDEYAGLLEKERDEKVSQATSSLITESEAYKLATNERLQISKESTEKLIDLIKKRVEAELAAGKISKEKAREILDSINSAGVERGYTNNPFQNLINGLKEYKAAKDKIETARSTGAGIAELAKLEDAANLAMTTAAAAAGTSLAGVRDILQTAVEGLDQLGLLTEEEKKTADEVIGMVSGAANLAMGIASGNPVQIIQGSIELLVNAFKLFDKKSKDIEKAQKKHKANLDDLARSYEKLQRSVDKALGTDAYKKQREQIANLQQRVGEYYKLIELEEQKKKKKQDAAAIAEWKAQIDELKAQMEDIVDNITESIAQTSAKDLAEELAQSLVDAFSRGESAAEAMGGVIDNVLKRAVMNALKLRYLEKPLQNIVDIFADDMESGGGLSKAEADRFRRSVESLGLQYYKAFEAANNVLGGIFAGDLTEDKTKGGIKGDVASMSEQTGSALVGQLNAMRLNVATILSQNKNTAESMTRIFATMERIKDNTEYCRLLERIDSNIQYLKQNGIEVK